MATQQVALDPGESAVVEFTVTPTAVKTYTVTVDGLSGTFECKMPDVLPGWTEGVVVQEVTVSPSIVYIGNPVRIGVYINYPYPLPLPVDIHGTVKVDGEELTGDWNIDFRNPTLYFTYTPLEVGTYTVTAQDKSATFTALQDISAAYYSPFGGTRIPLCVTMVVPNVEPFTPRIWHEPFPGGNFIMTNRFQYKLLTGNTGFIEDPVWGYVDVYGIINFVFTRDLQPVANKLSGAYPTIWNPTDSFVTIWKSYLYVPDRTTSTRRATALMLATNYNCKNYWESKEELARMIAGGSLTFRPTTPSEVLNDLGTTKVDLSRGIRDWTKDIAFGTNPALYTGIVYYNYTIQCPYCTQSVELNHKQGKLALARLLLDHIEIEHPEHPLTEPAWF